MARGASKRLARAERELERWGLLLRHDATLPSMTALLAGEPVRGSWWSHPKANEIYDLLQEFHRGAGRLAVKLVDGKVTYVHERLWPALLNAVRVRSVWQRAHLSAAAATLLAAVGRRGAVRTDQLEDGALGRAAPELETRLLVHAESVHTESGTHRKLLRTWARWCRDTRYACPRFAPRAGYAQLEAAAGELAAAAGAKARLPWPALLPGRDARLW
jgi:hypothetical protein